METKQLVADEEYLGLRPPNPVNPPANTEEEDQKMLHILFQSRPNRHRSIWHVYSTPTELYRLWYSLDERGEREKGLKELIASRYELEEPKQEYQTAGSEYIGRQVTRTFGSKVSPLFFCYFISHCVSLFSGGNWYNCWLVTSIGRR